MQNISFFAFDVRKNDSILFLPHKFLELGRLPFLLFLIVRLALIIRHKLLVDGILILFFLLFVFVSLS